MAVPVRSDASPEAAPAAATDAPSRPSIVRFENVTKRFDDGSKAVNGLNLEAYRGEFLVLIGPSGCGKTTTLKMINRLIEPTSGHIYVDGADVADMDRVALRRQIGYVIQQIGLFPHLTVAANISVVPRLLGWSKERQAQRVDELLRMVSMDPGVYADRYPTELSGGQQQRIGVLRALACEPDLILMDEPFGALDPITREQLQDELKRLQAKLHKTIIFVTHDMDEAIKLADRIVIMNEGVPVRVDTPEEILRHPESEFVRKFVGTDRMLRSPDDVTVGEVMITEPVKIGAHAGLRQALTKMQKHKVDSLMVVDDDDRLEGILVVDRVQRALFRGVEGRVGEHMHRDVPTVRLEETVRRAVGVMADCGSRHLPVVNEAGILKGLLTRARLVGILAEVLWNVESDGFEEVS